MDTPPFFFPYTCTSLFNADTLDKILWADALFVCLKVTTGGQHTCLDTVTVTMNYYRNGSCQASFDTLIHPQKKKISWCVSLQSHNFRVITNGHSLIEQVKGNLDLTKLLNV